MRGDPIRPQEAVRRVLPLPPDRRADALRRMLHDDPDALHRALDLLPTEGRGPVSTLEFKPEPSTPVRIGQHELRSVLGEGAFGVVWLATQARPLQRSVALKILRPDRLDPTSRARFDAERRLLALLNHPSLVKVFEAGETADGRPWFSMELAQGAPITDAADAARLRLDDRLRLISEVARAVHHAHLHGLVHRDLKPSNILLAIEGDQLQVKVIDFGVAHSTFEPVDPDQRAGAIVGTPDYLAPELSRLHTIAPDVRADVYALGVVMRRLLAGNDPSDRRSTPGAALALLDAQHQRRIAEDRRETPVSLHRRLHGDIDAIVARCLADDPRTRYASAIDLAQDIDRHLRGEAVQARGESLSYRGLVAARQNARAIAACALILLVAVIGFGWAMHERDLALRARDEAETQARRARNAHEFIDGLLHDIATASGVPDTPAIRLLDQASVRAAHLLADDPTQEAHVREALAQRYLARGARDAAALELVRASALLDRTIEADRDPGLRIVLAAELLDLKRLPEALDAATDAVLEARRQMPEDHDDVARALVTLARVQRARGEAHEAARSLDQATDEIERSPSDPGDVESELDRARRELGPISPPALVPSSPRA
jgi:tetratricopeptide (TPR) repeat protein